MDTRRKLRTLAAALATTCCLALAAPAAAAGTSQPGWVWPVGADGPPAVARGFDPPDMPWLPGHRGVDLVTEPGAQVRAAGAGVVAHAGPVAGVGVVTVTHGELRTTYQPVDASVSAGDRVATGDPIGTMEGHGSHCPPAACLHWGLLRADEYLDPRSLIRSPGRPRLLPLGPGALAPPPGRASGPGVRLFVGAT